MSLDILYYVVAHGRVIGKTFLRIKLWLRSIATRTAASVDGIVWKLQQITVRNNRVKCGLAKTDHLS